MAAHSRAFLQMSDDDIVQKIASECGLSANADATSQVFDYVLQNNLTDWEFLHERAARYGYEVYVTGTTLNFVKPKVDGSPTLSSTLWNDLLHIHAHATSVGQVSDVTVRGWDPAQKTAIVGQVTKRAATRAPGSRTERHWRSTSTRHTYPLNRRPVHTQAEADKLAQALADTHAGDSIRVEAEIVGNPAVKAGQMIDLKSLGQRYSGQYYLTAVTHRYGHRGYTTEAHGWRPSQRHAARVGQRGVPPRRAQHWRSRHRPRHEQQGSTGMGPGQGQAAVPRR